MNHTAVVRGDAVVLAIVQQDMRIWDSGHRTVQVAERQGPICVAAAVIVIEPGIEFREIDRLGVDEFRAADGATPRRPSRSPPLTGRPRLRAVPPGVLLVLVLGIS